MYKVIERRMIVPNLHEFVVEAPEAARSVKAGNFVIVRPEEYGERVPLSVADWDRQAGTVTVIFMQVGASTAKLARLKPGDTIPTFAGPLGRETGCENFGTVLCSGGCYGIGSLYPLARSLKEKGNTVYMLMEARSTYLLYWQERYRQIVDRLLTITRDGTSGYRGHVTRLSEILSLEKIRPDRVIANGCTFQMMKVSEETRPLSIKTMVNMNPIMIDGTGMCGVCRLTVAGEDPVRLCGWPGFRRA